MSRKSLIPLFGLPLQRKLVYTRLEEIDSPRALSIYLIMRHTDKNPDAFDDEIFNLVTNPLWFSTSSEFMTFYEPSELVRKSSFLRMSTSPEEVAKAAFFECELKCAEANRRIRTTIPNGRAGQILDLARKFIVDLLPPVDSELLDHLGDLGGWGSGVTSSNKGVWQSEFNKLQALQHATPALLPIAQAFISQCPFWSTFGKVSSVAGNKVAFVPKTAKTHRTIAVEPSFNAFLQKGAGRLLRRYLRRWGVDTRDQTLNQRLALEGSLTNELATVDLSAASDTISKAAVEYLLPSDWVSLLGLMRSEHYEIDGKLHRYHKWSSMGNGYTFELETLIFSSIVKAAVHLFSPGGKWAVYGDDLIFPSTVYADLSNLLSYLGFQVNHKKSFISGPFRESCGKDYFLGDLVRPFYLKEWKENTPFVWANWLKANEPRLKSISGTWTALFRAVPSSLRNLLPVNSGLLGFEVSGIEATLYPVYRSYGLYRSYYGWRVTGYRWVPKKLSRSKIDGAPAALAHVRTLSARVPQTDPGDIEEYLSGITVDSSLQVAARQRGEWVRTSATVLQWPALLT